MKHYSVQPDFFFITKNLAGFFNEQLKLLISIYMYISKSITVQFTQYAVIRGKVTFLVILHAYKKPGKIFLGENSSI